MERSDRASEEFRGIDGSGSCGDGRCKVENDVVSDFGCQAQHGKLGGPPRERGGVSLPTAVPPPGTAVETAGTATLLAGKSPVEGCNGA